MASKTAAAAQAPPRPYEEIHALRPRRLGQWLLGALVLVIAAAFARSLVTNRAFEWSVVRQYQFNGEILAGIRLTVLLTLVAMAIGIVLGIVIAVARLSGNKIVSFASFLYIWFFRGTPVLVQLIFWYNLGALYPRLVAGIPFGPTFAVGLGQLAHRASDGGHPRPGPQRGRLHGRDRACRHHLASTTGRCRPPVARHVRAAR